MIASEAPVLTERLGSVLLVTLNRPAQLNAWTAAMEKEYFDVLEAADDDPEVRAIVVTGAGRGFCAGADMSDLAHAPDATEEEMVRERPVHLPLALRKPLIGAINGPAAGIGLVQAMFFDVRFASPEALFLTSFSRRGLIAEYGISWILPQVIGRSRALDLLMSSRRVGGEEAFRIGLVDQLVPGPELVEAALAYAQDVATNCSPRSLSAMKLQVNADTQRGFDESTEHADVLMRESFRGPDIPEGVLSFSERRPPNFAPLAPKGS
ncbi:enoyl-CoA hydratase-related protein [Aeromicrobium sp.]|uniref:enoyl-CoA hydratase-related protein n=1 Tax=Aeromicrobium sp. TaxID=1871063 RepID=UPI002FCC0888